MRRSHSPPSPLLPGDFGLRGACAPGSPRQPPGSRCCGRAGFGGWSEVLPGAPAAPFCQRGFLTGTALALPTEPRARRRPGERVAPGRDVEVSCCARRLGPLGLFCLLSRSWDILGGVYVDVRRETWRPSLPEGASGRWGGSEAASSGPCRACGHLPATSPSPRLLAEPAVSQPRLERPCLPVSGGDPRYSHPADDKTEARGRRACAQGSSFLPGTPPRAAWSPQGAASRPHSALGLSPRHGGPRGVPRVRCAAPRGSPLAWIPCHLTDPLLLFNCPRLTRLSRPPAPGGQEGATGWLLASRRGWPRSRLAATPVGGRLVRSPEAGSSSGHGRLEHPAAPPATPGPWLASVSNDIVSY